MSRHQLARRIAATPASLSGPDPVIVGGRARGDAGRAVAQVTVL
ncbi:MAG: hypothetical protein M0T72_01185 [Candidatus Dormibacteraeota bacterium]|nr:hypothetical protein [Candidatus Dormibacteraeota bacterium]